MDNQLIFALGSSLAGQAENLSVRLVGATGDVDPDAVPLPVSESATVPGVYRATMVGAAGSYGALLLLSDVFVASIPTFRWDGAAFVLAAVEPTPVSGQFEEGDRAQLQALLALATADEAIAPNRYQKLAAGTSDVLLDKTVANDGAGNITLVEATP